MGGGGGRGKNSVKDLRLMSRTGSVKLRRGEGGGGVFSLNRLGGRGGGELCRVESCDQTVRSTGGISSNTTIYIFHTMPFEGTVSPGLCAIGFNS